MTEADPPSRTTLRLSTVAQENSADEGAAVPSSPPSSPAPSPRRSVFRVVTSPGEAQEHLRVIRQAMERSTKHSTLSGLSGITVGILALIGCALTKTVVPTFDWPLNRLVFVGIWLVVLLLALLADYVFAKRRAARFGKHAFSPLGRHLLRAAAPGLLSALVLSVVYVARPRHAQQLWAPGGFLYLTGIWMVGYAVALLGVGMFSRREVSMLGWAFLAAGAITLLLPPEGPITPITMMALTFGGLHIIYGIWMGRRYGW